MTDLAQADYLEIGGGELLAYHRLQGGGPGVNVNAQYGADKWSALLRACQRGDTGVVEVLLAHGANVNIKQQGRSTPLIIAAQEGRAETIKVLLKQPGIAIEDQLPEGRERLGM